MFPRFPKPTLPALVWAQVLLAAAPALAEPPAAKDPPVSETAVGEWYGWNVLIADAAGIVTGAALSFAIDDDKAHRPSDLALIGSAWYGIGAVAAPSIHFAHDGFGKGAASFGMRALLPPFTGVIGYVAGCMGKGEFDASCRRTGMTAGTLVGLTGAAAFDVLHLSYREAPPRRSAGSGEHWYGWQLLVLDASALVAGSAVAARSPRNEQGEKLEPQLALWSTGYVVGLFGGPIVHAVHGEWLNGLASLGARALVGPMGALPGLMGHCTASAGVSGCANTAATFGLLGGLILVDLFDAFVLGYEDVELASETGWVPQLSVAPGFIALSGQLP